MQRFPIQVAGVELEVRKSWGRRARLLRDGEEVPRDRWENYVITDAEGREHRPEIGFDWLQVSPVISDPLQHKVTVVAPLPKPVILLFGVSLVLAVFLGGILTAILVLPVQRLSVIVLRRPDRRALRVAAVALAWTALVALAVWRIVQLLS